MCHVYASTDPQRYENTTRSVRLQGSVTSVRLENEFWEILDDLAAGQNLSTGQFISRLYGEVIADKGDVPNLASLLRVACAVHLHLRAQPAIGEPQAASYASRQLA
ncbi:Predicted DNA-binding protein, contains Ribbon-helix-helix (RHH) domain [Modicisalibacter muralis]|uniref:Predicted DNA-binding protein, contains Ribbon-helix-helix (RHH) domain n=1 Tax=Modicisalibacter muralis TaxID=119000 RepID=A0A1G9KJ78_9GAMM|nr:ribbon-helix-helix domain-containing protein [Halomonas muralis]SDL49463.1 Predicted DNA-binding protein, contains Ribbon-helix-helix (RHH) domain [Halomonas muralis]